MKRYDKQSIAQAVENYKESNQTVAEYSKRLSISKGTFYKWMKDGEKASKEKSRGFTKFQAPDIDAETRYIIQYPNGVELKVLGGAEVQTLIKLVLC